MKENELLDKALDFIVETQEQNDYICDQMHNRNFGDYCAKNCQNLRKECVKFFLQKVYNKEKIMKANEAPEKLYLIPNGTISYCRNTDEDVEYTRTDAFIEKATEWLCNNYDKYIRVIGSSIYPAYSDLCRDFQNYVKGE